MFISNQLPNHSFIDFFGKEADEWVFYGSHFNYRERYPASDAVFKPDDASEAKFSNRASLVNAYDNSIRSTDRFLHDVITLLDRTEAVSAMLYTSDHDENIFDDGRRLFLHASPVPSIYELYVPFIIWTSDTYRRNYAQEANTLLINRHKSVTNSESAFHTMLGLAGIETPVRNDSLSVASRKFRPSDRMYLDDHDEPVPVNKILRDKQDFVLMKKIEAGK